MAAAPTEAEPILGGQTRQGPPPRWPDEAGPSKRCSRAVDCADESTLMVICSSSSGTLVLVPDSSPRAYGGVEYSFGGFSNTKDS